MSHVLSGRRSERFLPATRERVLAAAERLGYRVSAAARDMRRGTSGAVALLLSTVRHRSQLPQDLLVLLERGLAARERKLLVAALAEEVEDDTALPEVLASWSADGFLVNYSSHIPPRLLAAIDAHSAPAVWLNCRRERDCVHPDDELHGRLATAHLLARGHRRVAYIDCGHDPTRPSPGAHYSRHDRYRGYACALAAAGIAPEPVIAPPYDRIRDNRRWLREWLGAGGRPPAAVCYGGRIADRVATVALELGLRPGSGIDLATVEGDHHGDLGLPIASVALDHTALADAALAMLDRRLADPATPQAPVAVPGRLRTDG